MLHTECPEEHVTGIELIFIELQKFQTLQFAQKRLRALWLRFFTKINEDTTEAPAELLNEEYIRQAQETVQESAFTEEELAHYEKYRDSIRIEKTAIDEERCQKEAALLKLALKMKAYGETIENIAKETSLNQDLLRSM